MTNRSVFAVVAAVSLLAACDRQKAPAADSALSRDLELAQQSTHTYDFTPADTVPLSSGTLTVPEEKPRARETRPVPRVVSRAESPRRERAPEPAPVVMRPAPAPVETQPATNAGPGIIDAGTSLTLASGGSVCTTNRPGDKLTAKVESAISGRNGAVIPSGSTAVLEVASVTPGHDGVPPRIELRLRGVMVGDEMVLASGDVTTNSRLEEHKEPNGSDRKKVIGGAIAGAVLGRVMGNSTRATVIGAAAGAAAGTGVAMATRNTVGCLPAGAEMHVVLRDGIHLSADR